MKVGLLCEDNREFVELLRDEFEICYINSSSSKEIINDCDFYILVEHKFIDIVKRVKKLNNKKILYFPRELVLDNPKVDNYQLFDEIYLLNNLIVCIDKGYLGSFLEQNYRFNEYENFSHLSKKYFLERIKSIILREEIFFDGSIIKLNILPKILNNKLVYYEQAEFRGSVHIFPMDKDNNVYLIQERRIEDSSKYKTRIISGIIEHGEDPKETAKRELLEETGIDAKELIPLVEVSEDNAIKDTRYYFIAKGLNKTNSRNLDNSEDIKKELAKFSIKDLFDKSLEGFFGTSKSIIAINNLYYKYEKK